MSCSTTHGPEIDRIQVDYCRTTTVYPRTAEERAHWQSFTRSHSEHLILDRFSGTLELQFELAPGCSVTHKYQLKEQVTELLDRFSQEALFADSYPQTESGVEQTGGEECLVQDLKRSTAYLITIRYRGNRERKISGSYDKNCLPADYPQFMRPIFSLIQEFSFGEMIFPEVYEKSRRKKGELIYCSVVFDNGLKTYYYRTEDDSLDAGDDVVVPAGRDNHLSIARIVKVEYFAPADVPFPIEKTKVILRRCTEDDYNETG